MRQYIFADFQGPFTVHLDAFLNSLQNWPSPSGTMHKAFILGAGLGTRLTPLTTVLPKPLVPVFHRPLAEHALDHCRAAGCSSFAINTHHIPTTWTDAFPSGSYENCPIEFFHEPVLLETGGGLKNISPFVDDQPLLVYNGDLLTNVDLAALIACHKESGNVVTLGLRSSGPNCNIALKGDRVTDLRHARGVHPGTHQFTGIYCIEPQFLDLIPADEKISVVPAFLQLAEDGTLGGCVLDDGYWLDLGERESYLSVHQRTDIGPAIHPEAVIDPTAQITNSTIGPGCVIGANAIISDSVLWPGTRVLAETSLSQCILYSSNPATGVHVGADL